MNKINFLKNLFASNNKIASKPKIGYTNFDSNKISNLSDTFESRIMNTNNKDEFAKELYNKINNIFFADIKEPVYAKTEKYVDEYDICLEITEFFDSKGRLRKIERKNQYSDFLSNLEIYNEKGYLTNKVVTIYPSNDFVIVSKGIYDGTPDEILVNSEQINISLTK